MSANTGTIRTLDRARQAFERHGYDMGTTTTMAALSCSEVTARKYMRLLAHHGEAECYRGKFEQLHIRKPSKAVVVTPPPSEPRSENQDRVLALIASGVTRRCDIIRAIPDMTRGSVASAIRLLLRDDKIKRVKVGHFAVVPEPRPERLPGKSLKSDGAKSVRCRQILKQLGHAIPTRQLADMAGCGTGVALKAIVCMGYEPTGRGRPGVADDVYKYIVEHGGCTRQELLKAFPDSAGSSISRAAQKLEQAGKITRVRRGHYVPVDVLPDESAAVLDMLKKRGPLNARSLSLILELGRGIISDALTDLVDSGLVAWEPGTKAVAL